MIHTANSLLSNSLCTFPVPQSVNHYAPPLCPIHTGCESMSAPSLIAFLFSSINKKLLLAALEITSLSPASSQEGGRHIRRCPTSDGVEARDILCIGRYGERPAIVKLAHPHCHNCSWLTSGSSGPGAPAVFWEEHGCTHSITDISSCWQDIISVKRRGLL